MRDLDQPSSRRRFLAGSAAAAATVLTLHTPRLGAVPIVLRRPDPDAWLDALAGTHRQLFDSPEAKGGTVLARMLDYYETYIRAYGASDTDIAAVGALYSGTTAFALNDGAWSAFELGALLEIDDSAGGKPALRNPWRVDPVIRGAPRPKAGIEALQARGATFLVCNGALRALAEQIANRRGGQADAVHRELLANLLPGVVPVPSMVVTIEKAQSRGLAYYRQ